MNWGAVRVSAIVVSVTALSASCVLAGERAIALFDGKTLDGWTRASGEPVTDGWVVEDGMLVRTRGGGSIYTTKEYGDFDLSFDWKISARGNSGVKYRVAHYEKGVFGHPGWLGCEYQVFDDLGRRTEPLYGTGAIYALYAPEEDRPLRPAGEFNTSRIVAQGSKIEHWLNGKKVVSADIESDDWGRRIAESKFGVVQGFFKNPKGRIELQDHGNKVWFRNIVLTPLNAD